MRFGEKERAPGIELGEGPVSRRRFLGGLVSVSALALFAPASLLAATREERVLSFLHTHTHERLSVPYFADGDYLREGLVRLEHLLRDHRTGDEHPIDPHLFDLLYSLRQATGTKTPFRFGDAVAIWASTSASYIAA